MAKPLGAAWGQRAGGNNFKLSFTRQSRQSDPRPAREFVLFHEKLRAEEARPDNAFNDRPGRFSDWVGRKFRQVAALGPLFMAFVVLPTLIATIYFGLIASDVYVSESRFIVRSPGKTSTSPLGMILGGAAGFSMASEENHAVVDYVTSRNALLEVNRDGFLQRIYTDARVSPVDRFGWPTGTTTEHLYRYFKGKVDIELDTSSQITTLTVRAFSAQDAQRLNERLLQRSEGLVNQLSERGRRDAVASAQVQVDEARTRARNAVVALARFRNQYGIIDPEKQATINLQMVSKLQDALVAEQTQLAQLTAYTPQNPQIPAVRTRIANLQREIADQTARVAGGRASFSSAAPQYQQLMFDAEFGGKQLATALASLQEARKEANEKQVYVERIASPNLPDYPLEPRRVRNIIAVLVLGLLFWGVATTLLAGIREHRD